jgi:hypothetical protein
MKRNLNEEGRNVSLPLFSCLPAFLILTIHCGWLVFAKSGLDKIATEGKMPS